MEREGGRGEEEGRVKGRDIKGVTETECGIEVAK